MPNTTQLKPYVINMIGDNEAEINMYGEVVKKRPYDWRTGKPAEGNYIVLDEIIADLDTLRNKSKITIHINSVGGDFYAGLAIYNRLRTLSASITTINDGRLSIVVNGATGEGDGIDTNGNLIINGGTVDITGQSAVDYDGAGQYNGGVIIINGQQVSSLPNQMMGGGKGWRG